MLKDWLKLLFFAVNATFWVVIYRHDVHVSSFLFIAIFMSFLSLWMIIDKVKKR